jgi:Excreted virulence factor EspC, type VII ESX diderm
MTEPVIRVSPEALRDVANHHEAVADAITASRLAGSDIHAAVSTFGPIMHQFKAAVGDLLNDRDAALLAHDERHRTMASQLRRHANGFQSADDDTAITIQRLRPS